MRINWQQVGMVLLVLAWAGSPVSSGYALPFADGGFFTVTGQVVMFVSYVVMVRTLFRLPFAVNMARRRYRHAKETYNLDTRAALTDAFFGGFLDRRRWENGPLAIFDRLVLIITSIIACSPIVGPFLINFLGTCGIVLMGFLYIYTGRFAFLVDDITVQAANPFRNVPNLRRPNNDVF
ncbi:MAG: hypothetical protein AAFV33_05085 [Chloroflexota bacterium]